MPKELSTAIHHNGMSRSGAQINARGTTPAQAMRPNFSTQMLRTGSRYGPQKATAMLRWPKASQSVPYAMNGYRA